MTVATDRESRVAHLCGEQNAMEVDLSPDGRHAAVWRADFLLAIVDRLLLRDGQGIENSGIRPDMAQRNLRVRPLQKCEEQPAV